MIMYFDTPEWWWGDSGRGIICTLPDGTTEQGVLFIYDYFFDGEDEVPLAHLEMIDRTLDAMEVKWKFLKENE